MVLSCSLQTATLSEHTAVFISMSFFHEVAVHWYGEVLQHRDVEFFCHQIVFSAISAIPNTTTMYHNALFGAPEQL